MGFTRDHDGISLQRGDLHAGASQDQAAIPSLMAPVRSGGTFIETSSATAFTPLWDRKAEWTRRMEMISRAHDYLYLSTFYLEWDARGRECLQAVLEAQQRGVDTVLLIDRFGQRLGNTLMSRSDRSALESAFAQIRQAGGRVVKYIPKNGIDRQLGGGHHIKIQLSEDGEAIFGSSNISHRSFDAWNEFSVALRGPVVDLLMTNFFALLGTPNPHQCNTMKEQGSHAGAIGLEYWSHDPNQDRGRLGVFRRLEINPLTKMLADRIRQAQRTIQLTSFYYKPVPMIAEALKDASQRGVKTEVFHSHVSALDNRLPWLAAATDYASLLKHDVHVYENRRGEHSKIVLIDDRWAAFGSYNFEDAADDRLAEAMLVTEDPSILNVVREIFGELQADANNHRVTLEEFHRWPTRVHIAAKLFRPLKRWF